MDVEADAREKAWQRYTQSSPSLLARNRPAFDRGWDECYAAGAADRGQTLAEGAAEERARMIVKLKARANEEAYYETPGWRRAHDVLLAMADDLTAIKADAAPATDATHDEKIGLKEGS